MWPWQLNYKEKKQWHWDLIRKGAVRTIDRAITKKFWLRHCGNNSNLFSLVYFISSFLAFIYSDKICQFNCASSVSSHNSFRDSFWKLTKWQYKFLFLAISAYHETCAVCAKIGKSTRRTSTDEKPITTLSMQEFKAKDKEKTNFKSGW